MACHRRLKPEEIHSRLSRQLWHGSYKTFFCFVDDYHCLLLSFDSGEHDSWRGGAFMFLGLVLNFELGCFAWKEGKHRSAKHAHTHSRQPSPSFVLLNKICPCKGLVPIGAPLRVTILTLKYWVRLKGLQGTKLICPFLRKKISLIPSTLGWCLR